MQWRSQNIPLGEAHLPKHDKEINKGGSTGDVNEEPVT